MVTHIYPVVGGWVTQTKEGKRGSNQGVCHVAVDGQEKDGICWATMIPMELTRARKRGKGNKIFVNC